MKMARTTCGRRCGRRSYRSSTRPRHAWRTQRDTTRLHAGSRPRRQRARHLGEQRRWLQPAHGHRGRGRRRRAVQRTSTGCPAFGTDEYCCRWRFASSATCWPSGYWGLFKAQRPQAYSYAYDGSSTFTCNDGVDYQVTFCPSSGMSYEPHREQLNGGRRLVLTELTVGSYKV